MRLLHARDDHPVLLAPEGKPQAYRRADPLGDIRKPLQMHGLSEHSKINKGGIPRDAVETPELKQLLGLGRNCHCRLVDSSVLPLVDVAIGGPAEVACEVILQAQHSPTEGARRYLRDLGLRVQRCTPLRYDADGLL